MDWNMTGPMWAFLASTIAIVAGQLGYERWDERRYREHLIELTRQDPS